MTNISNLYPNRVFHYFEQIAGIPHGSGNTKQISDYLAGFAKEHDLDYYQDSSNNIVIIKEATEGYRKAEPVIIQGHMDMVCEKENNCKIDFMKDGLELYVDGDYLKAKDTTLGGDDGIAVAYALALLESDEIPHPKLEVIITVDEEIGMLGAAKIDLSMLTGHKMINIDSEEEGVFICGCAGGMALNAKLPVQRIMKEGEHLTITITGLEGGHSGNEIDKEHANADILMGRVLCDISEQTLLYINALEGGLKDNAIPRECTADILVSKDAVDQVEQYTGKITRILKKEFIVSDPEITVTCQKNGQKQMDVLDTGSVQKILFYLRTVPNGIQNMSQQMKGLVETSLNLGIMKLEKDEFRTVTSIRSSISSRKRDLCKKVSSIVKKLDGTVDIEGEYPAWEYLQNSPLREEIANVYRKLFNKEPVFETIHAGLECGILSEKIPDLDCVSCGPDNYDIHTPKEHLSISSVGRVWDFLVAFLHEAKE